jgi:CheY-like chemotaxis protein
VILLVEDDPNDALLMRRAFRKLNLENGLHILTDGEEAVAYLGGARRYADRARYPFPRTVVLDLKLPRRSGLEVLEWIRGNPVTRDLPVYILSSSEEKRDMARARQLGIQAYLVKHVGFANLEDTARRIAGKVPSPA